MTLKVLGPGCANCKRLEANVRKAVDQLGLGLNLLAPTILGGIA